MKHNIVGETINTTMFVIHAGHCPSSGDARTILGVHRRVAPQQWTSIQGPTSKYPPEQD